MNELLVLNDVGIEFVCVEIFDRFYSNGVSTVMIIKRMHVIESIGPDTPVA